jgi:hypothetical protein
MLKTFMKNGVGNLYNNRRFLNSRPEPDLRKASKSYALILSSNAIYTTNFHGLNLAVCGVVPLL